MTSSLKERVGVKGGFGLQFCGRMAFSGHDGMAHWLAFPDRCRVRVSGLAGQGPGGARPRGGAAGVLEALVREPIMAGAGKGRGRVCGLCGYGRPIVPLCGVAGLPAAVIPSGVPRPGWPGGMGRFASRGGRSQSRFRSRRPGWSRLRRRAQDFPVARPSGPAAHTAWLMARRICPSRRP